MKIQWNSELLISYMLSTIGDLTYAILVTGCVLYGNQLGGRPSETGIIGGAYGLTYLITPAILGRVGDKISRKFSLMVASIGQIFTSLFYLLIANTIELLIVGQILLGIVYGFHWPAIEALISENTHETVEKHKKGMSNFCIAWSIGFTLGPLIAGIFSDIDVRQIFSIVLILYIIAFLLIIFGLKSKKKLRGETVSDESEDNIIDKERISRKKLDKQAKRNMIRILFGSFIYAMMAKLIFSYFADYAVRPETLDWSGTLTGIVIFTYGLGRTSYFILARFINKGIFQSSFKGIQNSFLIIVIAFPLITLIQIPWLMILLFYISGFFIGLIYISSLDLLIVNEKNAKGALAGIFESLIGLGTVIAPFIAGFLGEFDRNIPFFAFSGLVLFIYLFSVFLSKKNIRKIEKENQIV